MAFVEGTNNSETINFFDGVTFVDDFIFGFGGDDSIFGLARRRPLSSAAPAPMRSTVDQAPIRRFTGNSTAGIMASLSYGVGVGGDAEGDTYFSIENLIGSGLRGRARRQRRQQLAFRILRRRLPRRPGRRRHSDGGSGNDTLKGGGGADGLWGNQGIDTASYYESPEGVLSMLNAFETSVERAATPKATPSRASRTSPARSMPTSCGEMTASTSSWAWTATTASRATAAPTASMAEMAMTRSHDGTATATTRSMAAPAPIRCRAAPAATPTTSTMGPTRSSRSPSRAPTRSRPA